MQQFRETAARLQTAYAGEKAAGIQEQEQEVARALRELLEACSGRRARLVDTADKHRFFGMARDLLSWMESTVRQIETQEKPRYGGDQQATLCCDPLLMPLLTPSPLCPQGCLLGGAAHEVPSGHPSRGGRSQQELQHLHRTGQEAAAAQAPGLARGESSWGPGRRTGTVPPGPPHDDVPSQIKAKLVELMEKRKAMMETWEQRWDQLRLRECAGGAGGDRGSARRVVTGT